MFGFVMASSEELSKEEKQRYSAVYCGICRQIRERHSSFARLGLSFDLAFLALLLMSLYEPEETKGKRACGFHPVKPRPWTDNAYIAYCADMNVALAYYKAKDDSADEKRLGAKVQQGIFGKKLAEIKNSWPRQCAAIEACLQELESLEKENCSNPDLPAACFGRLMAELCVYEEDFWADDLRQMGMALGRFVYLADAAVDYRKDQKKGNYNPFLAMGMEEDWARWEQFLVMEMAECTQCFERLPLVQDKKILDNILYSGVWLQYRQKQKQVGGTK